MLSVLDQFIKELLEALGGAPFWKVTSRGQDFGLAMWHSPVLQCADLCHHTQPRSTHCTALCCSAWLHAMCMALCHHTAARGDHTASSREAGGLSQLPANKCKGAKSKRQPCTGLQLHLCTSKVTAAS